MRPLPNPRHEAFCQYFTHGHPATRGKAGNAVQSYIAAGYEARGDAARAASSRLLRRREIQERLEELSRAAPRSQLEPEGRA